MAQATRFEKARLISARALQLAFGAPPLIKANEASSAYNLAKKELQDGVLPLTVIRHYPDGRLEKLAV